jgi:DNA-binding MarR family transcriptional regulator
MNKLENNPLFKVHKYIFLAEKLFDRVLMEKFNISFSQFRVLAVISENQGISQKQIAFIQETTQASVSRHIDVLDKMHLVSLTTNSANRKEHNLYLTAKGKILFVKTLKFVEKKADVLLKTISKKKTVELSKTFDILLTAMHKECNKNKPC